MKTGNRRPIKWTEEDRAKHDAIRETFKDWRPGPEELIASGEAARLGLDVVYSPAQELLQQLKKSRARESLSLSEVSARSGIDEPILSQLENGTAHDLTLDMLWRYAAALGKRLRLSAIDIKDSRSRTLARTGRGLAKQSRKKQRA